MKFNNKNLQNNGIIDNALNPNDSKPASKFSASKLFGKAQITNQVNQYIASMLSEDENVMKVFLFLTDEIVLTNYGIYHYDRRLVGKSIEVKFINYDLIAGVSYSRGGKLSTSGHIKILYKFGIESLFIKISKKDEFVAKDLINLIKDVYLNKISDTTEAKVINLKNETIAKESNEQLLNNQNTSINEFKQQDIQNKVNNGQLNNKSDKDI